jgi:SpoIID/LytB domain protein
MPTPETEPAPPPPAEEGAPASEEAAPVPAEVPPAADETPPLPPAAPPEEPPAGEEAPPPPKPAAPPGAKQLEIVNAEGQAVAAALPPLRIYPTGDGMVKVLGVGHHWDGVDDRVYAGEIRLVTDSVGLLSVVNVMDVETYLQGVVPSEMSAEYPLEALKAQAVAARGTILSGLGKHSKDGFDLCNTEHCQVYAGAMVAGRPVAELRSASAVAETRGEVLTYQGTIARTLYSAICGGHTENSEDVWGGEPVPYLRGVADFDPEELTDYHFPINEAEFRRWVTGWPMTHCFQPRWSNLNRFRWVEILTRRDLERGLNAMQPIGTLTDIIPLARAPGGRLKQVEIRGTDGRFLIARDYQIRTALGGRAGPLRSSAFVVDTYRDDTGTPIVFVFRGAGWGHGVGMCQVGAVGLAELGRDYREILAHYYRGTEIQTRY